LGATVLEETPVGGLRQEGGRVTGVHLQDRDVSAEMTVLATGAWTRFLGDSVGVTLPTKPVKGQLIAFANAPLRPSRLIAGHGGYARPRLDGTTLVAATEEDVGFDRRVTGDGVAWLLDLTRTLCPILLQGEVKETWTGLRPGSETENPLIGPVPGVDGLWVSAGHFRTGAKEAPATAELVAEALTTGETPALLRAFDPAAQRVMG
jgi:glycine oxidase